jgi:hypothetical protein
MRAALAEAREQGEPFDRAWKLALATVSPSAEMRSLLAETRDAWRRAYDDEPPTQSERAAGQLIDALDREPVAA